MKFRSFALPLALIALSFTASAETNRFDIINTNNGKKIGTASYSINQGKKGLKLQSNFDLTLSAGGTNDIPRGISNSGSTIGGGGNFVDLEYSSDYKLNPDGSFISGYSQDSGNQTMITMASSKTRDSVNVGQTRLKTDLGIQTVPLPKPDYFLLPDYDPGAIQVLLNSALASPHGDHSYVYLIPANYDVSQNNTAGVAVLMPEAGASGTLDGKPVSLKHYSLNFGSGKSDIYTDDSGALMEADIAPLKANYIRSKFSLTSAH